MEPQWLKTVKEYGSALLIAAVLALFIRTFVVQAFKIPSGSMLETLQIGDQLLVNKFLYGVKAPFTDATIIPVSQPGAGDVIVFRYPEDERIDFIKRIIGLPGDTIEIKKKEVYRNGQKLDEPYVRHSDAFDNLPVRDNYGPIIVPEGKYFVLGDNRDDSRDSRYWGFVERNEIRGKAFIIYWSWDGWSVRWDRIGRLVE